MQRWATGLNDYWPTIQTGLVELPIEMNAVSERIREECIREDEVINDHLDMLIELLQGYKVQDCKCLLRSQCSFCRTYAKDLRSLSNWNNELFTKQQIKTDVH